jgi:hypothetical protein
MKIRWILLAAVLSSFVAGCGAPLASPTSTGVPTPTRGALATFTSTAVPEATVTPTLEAPPATPSPTALVVRVEPTFTPRPGNDSTAVGDLPIGQLGHGVNVAFGYWLQYPPEWYTGFGNRPLLVSFSNLDPGTHNRDIMRAEGCLLEITSSVNIYGIPPQDLARQLPGVFPNAEGFQLDGEEGIRVPPVEENQDVLSEMVMVDHEGRLLILTFDYARSAADSCQPAWENVLSTWQWFSPDMALYRNVEYGYSVGHPRRWYRFNSSERGIFISSVDPTGAESLLELMREGMVVQTNVFDNPEGLHLKEWVAAQDWTVYLTNDIPLEGLVGVRVLRPGPFPGIEGMAGYFEGATGQIHAVICNYPTDEEWEFRPIANAIIYSFAF